MQTSTLAAAGVALLVVAAGAALLAGVVPLPDDGAIADTPRPTATAGGSSPTADGTATPGDGTASPGDGTASPGDGSDLGAEFRLEIDNVEECGTTCRDVTTTLTNVGDASASDVSVRTTLFVGNSTDESNQIWEGTEDVGTLPAGESYTATKRVTLSLSEGFAVQQADGWVTIRTTIRTAEGSVTYTERRDVD